MAVVTINGHVSRAKQFMERDDVYISLGGQTPWESESEPPTPDVNDTIDDLIVMKKVETKVLVTLDDENGNIEYMGHKYRAVAPELAYQEGARWVYCMAWFTYAEAPVDVSFRKVGLNTDVVRKSSVPAAQYYLLPSEIENEGIVEIIDNIQPIYRRVDKKERIAIVAEF